MDEKLEKALLGFLYDRMTNDDKKVILETKLQDLKAAFREMNPFMQPHQYHNLASKATRAALDQ